MSKQASELEHRNLARELRRKAGRCATLRGHELTWGEVEHPGSGARATCYGECARCGMPAHVDTRPPPNGIDIGGSAVAMTCAIVAEGGAA